MNLKELQSENIKIKNKSKVLKNKINQNQKTFLNNLFSLNLVTEKGIWIIP